MKKSIAIIEGSRIKRYRLGAVCLPLTEVRKHLYRTDDEFFHRDLGSDDSILFTDLDSTQVYGDGEKVIDPDDAIALLDTSVPSTGRNVGIVGNLMKNPMSFIYLAIGVVIVLSALGLK